MKGRDSGAGLLVLLGIVALGILTTGAVVVYSKIRGIRNNNPGNIRKSAEKWQGLAASQDGDASFFQFISPEYGIRALGKILGTYRAKYGADTIAEIVRRWAPPTENDTAAYIAAVSRSTGIAPEVPLQYPRDLQAMVEAIIKHENGIQPYSDATVKAGLALA